MTEEIIINGVDVAGCSLYLNGNGKCLRLLTDNEPETECNAICDYGCLYHKEQLKRLEQENKALQAYKDINEDLKKAWDELNEKYKQLRSVLEEINKITEPRFVNGLNEEADLCNLAMDRIQNKINEVLNDK